MTGKSDVWETDLLELFFQNIAAPNIGDASGLQPAGAAGTLSIALHTADPTDSGTQTSSEAAYTGYARETVARSAGGWTVSGDTVDNAAIITFTISTSGPETETHVSIGGGFSNNMFYSGALDASLIVNSGTTPQFNIGALNVTEA